MSCIEPPATGLLTPRERATLLRVARASIAAGLATDKPLAVDVTDLHGRLGEPGASFVSIYHRAELRGCVGNLAAQLPLAQDVARNAHLAASRDRRFEPLAPYELAATAIEVSVLSAPEAMECGSEADLLRQLVPHVDGLILIGEDCRATFLPKVWEQLPVPAEFLRALKRKAGLATDYWSASLRFARYRATVFADS